MRQEAEAGGTQYSERLEEVRKERDRALEGEGGREKQGDGAGTFLWSRRRAISITQDISEILCRLPLESWLVCVDPM